MKHILLQRDNCHTGDDETLYPFKENRLEMTRAFRTVLSSKDTLLLEDYFISEKQYQI
ncbi:hypothetical protein ABFE25_31055 [Bacillus toyonensis]|uniref:hypothetical protein n=1 Tax=Bacillus toyonensis TaxID=155322 RepID=UPI00321B012F